MIPLILVISGMLVYEMKVAPPNDFKGPGKGLVMIPAVPGHTPYLVFDPADFEKPDPNIAFLPEAVGADLITLPDGTQRARIDLTDTRLEIGSGDTMTAKWNGTPNLPKYDLSAPDTLDWVPSFSEMLGPAQVLKTDFSSVVSIGLGSLTSAGHPIDPRTGQIASIKFTKKTSVECATAHGLARFLRLDADALLADGTRLIILLKNKSGKTLAAGRVVAAPRGPVAMSITNFPSKLTTHNPSPRLEHLDDLFKAALQSPPAPDKTCLPSTPTGTVTGSSAFCPPARP